MENNLVNLQDLWRRERDVSNAGNLDVQKRLDMLEYKSYSNEKDLKQIIQQQMASSSSEHSEKLVSDSTRASQNEILMLKQILNQ